MHTAVQTATLHASSLKPTVGNVGRGIQDRTVRIGARYTLAVVATRGAMTYNLYSKS